MSRRRTLAALAAAVGLLGGCATSTTGAPAARPVYAPVRAVAAPAAAAPARAHRAVATAANPCHKNTAPQLVRVSLHLQHLWMCAHHTVAYSTPITSGVVGPDTSTPTGDYTIQGRNRHSTLTLNTGAQYAVKYWIPFHAPLYGFHDSSWQKFPYGSAKYRTQGSHGCVHMPLTAIRFLYHWAEIGAKVHIRR